MEEGDSLFDDIPSISSVANKHAFNGGWNASDEEITFSGKLKDCCICYIDIISSTKVTSELNPEQIGKYYAMFLNSTAIIAKNFGATIIKNAGDSLIYYFPNATKPAESIDGDGGNGGNGGDGGKSSLMAFKDVIECSMTIIAARDIVNSKLYEEKLPSLNYRISAEYGTVEFAKSVSSQNQDLFGPTMNFCAKMNTLAPPNGMIIGNSLYQIVKSFDDYAFEKVGGYHPPDLSTSPDLRANNCVYAVTSIRKKTILNPFSKTPKTKPMQTVSSPLVGGKHGSDKAYHFASSSGSMGPELEPKTRASNRIMLVDDEEDVLFTFKTFLQSEGWDIDAFANPQEALRQFEKDASYGLVITDIKMPNLNGLELYNKMKSKNSDTRVLFISALDGAEMILSVFPDLTEKNLIKKPVEKEKMVKTIKSMLRHGNGNDGYGYGDGDGDGDLHRGKTRETKMGYL